MTAKPSTGVSEKTTLPEPPQVGTAGDAQPGVKAAPETPENKWLWRPHELSGLNASD